MDNWLFLEVAWWIMRIGVPWQKLPAELGDLHTTYTHFNGRGASGRWRMILDAIRGHEDWEVRMIDGAVARAPGKPLVPQRCPTPKNVAIAWRAEHEDSCGG